MDLKTALFEHIGCDTVKSLIVTCALKTTDRITWGRLLCHLRGCFFCRQLFIQYHQVQIADIADMVISREILAEHRLYPLAVEVAIHFTEEQLKGYPEGDFTEDELALITEHIKACHECKAMVPSG